MVVARVNRIKRVLSRSASAFVEFYRLVLESARRMNRADIQILASSLAYNSVIALVPLLAISLSVFRAFGGLESIFKKIEPVLIESLFYGSGVEISRSLQKAIDRVHSGALGVTGVVGMLITSTKLFRDLELAVHRVWEIPIRRSFFRRIMLYWVVMFIGPVAMAIVIGFMSSRDLNLLGVLPKGSINFTLTFCALWALYQMGPSCHVWARASISSAALATCAIAVLEQTYAIVFKKILNYSKVYGSLASIPMFLIWLLLIWWVCLIGIAIAASIQEKYHPDYSNPNR